MLKRISLVKLVGLLSLSCFLCACTTVKKHWEDNPSNYKNNDANVAPLTLPKDYNQSGKVKEYYPIPKLPKLNKAKGSQSVNKLIVPPGIGH